MVEACGVRKSYGDTHAVRGVSSTVSDRDFFGGHRAPAFRTRLLAAMRKIGRPLDDIRAMVVSNRQLDHIGLAERLRTDLGPSI